MNAERQPLRQAETPIARRGLTASAPGRAVSLGRRPVSKPVGAEAFGGSMFTVQVDRGAHRVATLAEAGALVAARTRAKSSSRWYGRNPKGALVLDADGQMVATVSFNGRVWLPDGSEAVEMLPAARAGESSR